MGRRARNPARPPCSWAKRSLRSQPTAPTEYYPSFFNPEGRHFHRWDCYSSALRAEGAQVSTCGRRLVVSDQFTRVAILLSSRK